LQGVRDAAVEDIARIPGFSAASAQRILDRLRERDAIATAGDTPSTTE
jgi:hypothetical protein